VCVLLLVTVTKDLRKQLKRGRIYFAHGLQRFQSMVSWLHRFFGLWQGRSIMGEGHGRGNLLTSWKPGSRESDREGLGTR
jgi:hypothetical protein